MIERISSQFSQKVLASGDQKGIAYIKIAETALHDCLKFCKNDSELLMDMLLDIVAVDYLGKRDVRFELNYILYSSSKNRRFIVKVAVSEQKPMIATVDDLWKSANWAEREVFDMIGIKFMGHPNLKRILMFEGFEGHPLRKDYAINHRQQIPDVQEVP